MESMNITKARKNLYKLVEDVNISHVPVMLTGKDKNAVLVSAEDWHAMEETVFLNSIPGLAEKILEARKEPLSEGVNIKDVSWDE